MFQREDLTAKRVRGAHQPKKATKPKNSRIPKKKVDEKKEEEKREEELQASQKAKYNEWVERQHASLNDLPEVELPESYKQERAARAKERNAAKLEKKAKRKQELDALLASNPAISTGRALFRNKTFMTPSEQRRQAQVKAREEEQKELEAQRKKRFEQRYKAQAEKLERYNRETELINQEYRAQEAANQAELARRKAEKQAKKLEFQRKKADYEKRREARKKTRSLSPNAKPMAS